LNCEEGGSTEMVTILPTFTFLAVRCCVGAIDFDFLPKFSSIGLQLTRQVVLLCFPLFNGYVFGYYEDSHPNYNK
jgi:hypothetical protein